MSKKPEDLLKLLAEQGSKQQAAHFQELLGDTALGDTVSIVEANEGDSDDAA